LHSKAYLHHLFKVNEILALQIASIHNLAFYLRLVKEARKHILTGDFTHWKSAIMPKLQNRL
jgi:queuine tRNA-ribosyltransferase